MRKRAEPIQIEQVEYRPSTRQALDLEVFTMSNLRGRVSAAHLQRHHRYDFHMFVCVSRGSFRAVVDFNQIECRAGSVLVVRPAQVHRFDIESRWDGWILLFRPELLQVGQEDSFHSVVDLVEALPPHLALQGRAWRFVGEMLARMQSDCGLDAQRPLLQRLLQSELVALVTRLHIVLQGQQGPIDGPQHVQERFHSFRRLVETHFHEWHHVSRYAQAMACSERTLARACNDAAGVAPKAFIALRIALEAKRLLVHTELPVAAVGARVGFNQVTNFVKFFRSAEECTPGEFRRRHAGVLG